MYVFTNFKANQITAWNLKLITGKLFWAFFFLGGPIYRIQSIEMTRQHMQIHRKTAQRF